MLGGTNQFFCAGGFTPASLFLVSEFLEALHRKAAMHHRSLCSEGSAARSQNIQRRGQKCASQAKKAGNQQDEAKVVARPAVAVLPRLAAAVAPAAVASMPIGNQGGDCRIASSWQARSRRFGRDAGETSQHFSSSSRHEFSHLNSGVQFGIHQTAAKHSKTATHRSTQLFLGLQQVLRIEASTA